MHIVTPRYLFCQAESLRWVCSIAVVIIRCVTMIAISFRFDMSIGRPTTVGALGAVVESDLELAA